MPTDLPNLLTLSRIAAVPILVLLAFTGGGWGDFAASMLFSVAAITDYFDGKIARDRQMTSAFGRMLDPIADKLLVGAALMLLAGLGRLSLLGLLPAIVILLREILVSGLREYLAAVRVNMPVTNLAKWKTGFQMGALGVLLAGDSAAAVLGIPWARLSLLGEIGLWVAAALTLVTGWDYMRSGLRHAGAQDAQAVGTLRGRS